MATTTASKYVVNIVDLQNTITSASGLSPVATLSNTVAQLQEMLIYDEKRIAVNTISKYSQSPIQVTDSMNFASNATLSLNGVGVGAGTGDASFGSVSSIGYVSSFTNYFSTVVAGETAISFQVGSPAVTPMRITADGDTVISGGLTLTGAGTPGVGYYLTCLDTVGTAEWRVPGSVSDLRWKTNVRRLEDSSRILEGIRGVRFEWLSGGAQDVGVIAQEVSAVLPEAVREGDPEGPSVVEYHKIIPVLVEAIKELSARVRSLENGGTK
jgi:hypothetical protein